MRWSEKAMQSYDAGWRHYMSGLEKSLKELDDDISEADKMAASCTKEWCEAMEHVIDELSNAVFSLYEPTFVKEEDSKKIKDMRKHIHDLYAKYKSISK